MQPNQPCLLNRSEVAAGDHEVTLIGEGAQAIVVLRTASGAEVFRGAVAEGGGEELPAGPDAPTASTVRLGEGTYRVECLPQRGRWPSSSSSTTRTVRAAVPAVTPAGGCCAPWRAVRDACPSGQMSSHNCLAGAIPDRKRVITYDEVFELT